MEKVIWGETWTVNREKAHGRNTRENLGWCFVTYGSDQNILVLDQILLEDDLTYLLNTFQTTSSESVLKKETYIPIGGLNMDHIEDVLYYVYGV